jgi:Tripartite tricarboxylate transporter family receptor
MKTALRQDATPQHRYRSRPRGNNRPYPKRPYSGQHARRRFLGLAAGAAAVPAPSCITWAQSYPARPITMIVPTTAGGPADILARVLADRMRKSLGQPVIVENVSGANGNIGTGRVARARANPCYGLPGLLHGQRMEELAFAQGRGPDPAVKDNLGPLAPNAEIVGGLQDPLN